MAYVLNCLSSNNAESDENYGYDRIVISVIEECTGERWNQCQRQHRYSRHPVVVCVMFRSNVDNFHTRSDFISGTTCTGVQYFRCCGDKEYMRFGCNHEVLTAYTPQSCPNGMTCVESEDCRASPCWSLPLVTVCPSWWGNHINVGPVSCWDTQKSLVERNGSRVELRTIDYENPGSNPVLRC